MPGRAAGAVGVEKTDEGRRLREVPCQDTEHRVEGGVRVFGGLFDLPHVLLENGGHRGTPVGEVPVENTLPDPGPARDRGERSLQSVLREDFPGGGDQGGPVTGGSLRPVVHAAVARPARCAPPPRQRTGRAGGPCRSSRPWPICPGSARTPASVVRSSIEQDHRPGKWVVGMTPVGAWVSRSGSTSHGGEAGFHPGVSLKTRYRMTLKP